MAGVSDGREGQSVAGLDCYGLLGHMTKFHHSHVLSDVVK